MLELISAAAGCSTGVGLQGALAGKLAALALWWPPPVDGHGPHGGGGQRGRGPAQADEEGLDLLLLPGVQCLDLPQVSAEANRIVLPAANQNPG